MDHRSRDYIRPSKGRLVSRLLGSGRTVVPMHVRATVNRSPGGHRRRLAIVGTAAVAVAAAALLSSGAQAHPTAVVGPTQSWVTDGDVLALASAGGSTYVGGDFGLIGRSTGGWAEIRTGAPTPVLPGGVVGGVEAAETDGRGGWFLLGDISAVGRVEAKTEIVHLDGAGDLDEGWTVHTDGAVYTMARSRNRLYVGGSFSKLNGTRRAGLAALDVHSGAVLEWQPRIAARTKEGEAVVRALAPAAGGRVIYVGGAFGRVDGVLRPSLAAVGADGSLLPFDPGARYAGTGDSAEDETATVSIVSPDPRGRVVYAAGDFEQLGGAERAGLGAVDARTGRARPWDPDCDGDVWAIEVAPAGSPVYVAGEFASIGGKSRRGLAGVDAKLGTATLWDPGIGGAVHAITLDARRHVVYAGGEFETVGDVDRANLASVNTLTGKATGWDFPVIGVVDVVRRAAGGVVAVGGDFVSVGALRREGLAALVPDGSAVTAWQAPARGTVRALAADPRGGRVYVGGRFALGDSRTQRSLATIDLTTGVVSPWGPTVNSGVWAIAPAGDGETVFVGGAFTTIEGKARRRLGALRAADGSLLPWNTGASAVVRALAWTPEELWAGGQFTTIGGEPRRGIASIEVATGQTTGWDAGANGNVEALARIGELVYAAGPFTAIGGRSRKHLAALEAVDGSATRWDPAPDDVVRALVVPTDASQLLVAGDFEKVGGGRRDVASFDLATGFVTDWRPVAPFSGLALAFAESGALFVGGEGALVVFDWPPVL